VTPCRYQQSEEAGCLSIEDKKNIYLEDGKGKFLMSFGTYMLNCTASQSGRE
jgi:hypothetical protein